jgi:hypothetical protein
LLHQRTARYPTTLERVKRHAGTWRMRAIGMPAASGVAHGRPLPCRARRRRDFHADQEAVRVLALSLDEARRGQAMLPGSSATPGERTQRAAPPQVVSPGTPPGGAGRPERP